jgi:hypothetical protein
MPASRREGNSKRDQGRVARRSGLLIAHSFSRFESRGRLSWRPLALQTKRAMSLSAQRHYRFIIQNTSNEPMQYIITIFGA